MLQVIECVQVVEQQFVQETCFVDFTKEDKAVIGCATGCLNVSSFQYPYVAWEDSYIHSAFENASSTMAGVEGAYKAMKRKGKIKEDYKFIVFGGDGGTYDIGISHCQVQWNVEQIIHMCAMTMVLI